jgi:hypothetical protein
VRVAGTRRPSAVLPRPERVSRDRIDRRVGRTSLSRPSQSVLLPHIWAELNDERVRNDYDPDQRSHGHRDKPATGASGHRKVGINEGRQPHRWLATIRLTLLPGRRPRLCRTQPWLPIRGPQLRARSTKVLGPTLDQHVETHITPVQNPRSRGSSPPGNHSAKRYSHDHRSEYRKVGGAETRDMATVCGTPNHGEGPSSDTLVCLNGIRCCRAAFGNLPTRQVVTEDGPHPPVEPEPSPPGASIVVLAGRATRVP